MPGDLLSVLGQSWSLRPLPPGFDPSQVKVPPILAEILARRGHLSAERWLQPSLRREMPDPLLIPNMGAALQRLATAVKERQQVGIIGDYDVDGATSCAILIRWLRAVGLPEPIFHIPQRLTEGYGPNTKAIDRLHAARSQLLIIADSGTIAFDAVQYARNKGMDVIVLDHHDPQEDGVLPDAIVVNPKLADGEFSYLCTAGLAFLTLVGLARALREDGWFSNSKIAEPNLMDLLGLAALGTVADMVPLVGLNRAYVVSGLPKMTDIPGLGSLVAINGLTNPASTYAAGFILGPCINAGGRIGDTTQGTRLLLGADLNEVASIAQDLVHQNLQRREMQKKMVDACVETASRSFTPETRMLVLFNPDWHPGIVGLGAARVKDFFGVTTVVIGQDGKGSGRSVHGFHIGRAFMRAVALGLLKKGGGHAAAGGLTIDPLLVDRFRLFLEQEAMSTPHPVTHLDLVRRVGEITVADVDAMERLGPFGMGNPRPRIMIQDGILSAGRIFKEAHIDGFVSSPTGRSRLVLFHGHGTPLGKALLSAQGRAVDLLGSFAVNEYKGRRSLQFTPDDLRVRPSTHDLPTAEAA